MPTDNATSTSDDNPEAKQTRVPTAGTVRLLVQEGPRLAPVVSQGSFGEKNCGAPDALLRSTASKKPRWISASGCGLCALTSYLAAADLKGPRYDRSSKTFSIDASAKPVTPGTFNRYLWNKVDSETTADVSKESLVNDVYAMDGKGALNYKSATLTRWIEELVEINGLSIDEPFRIADETMCPNPKIGSDIPILTEHLEAGEPAIVGVSFIETPSSTAHQVLAIGYARVGAKTFYLILDSGFGALTPAPLLNVPNPAPIARIKPYAVSEQPRSAMHGTVTYAGITWVRQLSGLASLTKFRLLEDWTLANPFFPPPKE
ncbi:hypothetical protein [Pendulispora albinea]|uniref:Peptidase C39-like domain-containing protein n=1 Tax=Pendulispora albinea TaxID=2741071 RepID=A0ABZ2LNH3_9BACT